ncbi:hypothetical protein GWK36_11245 [Caldichromatium japonicum]|uniref:SoxXA-binding protein n=1 Tax=Caldichromatium japonicum TaxID=2699430 RepID=A0A6G7VF27_9GAMM|nr:hypothetical protein [Caldichromatium japonicum]QIK38458.1 hypothetical protein GWK36_11245 [Caldichromatium japonicum]
MGHSTWVWAGLIILLMSNNSAWAEENTEVEQAIAAAEAARQRAASVGSEWRDTALLIARAKELARTGEIQQAIELADHARRQGELGYEQALREQHADFPAYVLSRSSQDH